MLFTRLKLERLLFYEKYCETVNDERYLSQLVVLTEEVGEKNLWTDQG